MAISEKAWTHTPHGNSKIWAELASWIYRGLCSKSLWMIIIPPFLFCFQKWYKGQPADKSLFSYLKRNWLKRFVCFKQAQSCDVKCSGSIYLIELQFASFVFAVSCALSSAQIRHLLQFNYKYTQEPFNLILGFIIDSSCQHQVSVHRELLRITCRVYQMFTGKNYITINCNG